MAASVAVLDSSNLFNSTRDNQHNNIFESDDKKNVTVSTFPNVHTLRPPFMVMKRDKASDIMKQLIFPQSPAFVHNVVKNPSSQTKSSKKTKSKLEGVVDYCRSQNIPFLDEEDRYYKVNQFKQSLKIYSQSLNKCFETNRPQDFEIGVKCLEE